MEVLIDDVIGVKFASNDWNIVKDRLQREISLTPTDIVRLLRSCIAYVDNRYLFNVGDGYRKIDVKYDLNHSKWVFVASLSTSKRVFVNDVIGQYIHLISYVDRRYFPGIDGDHLHLNVFSGYRGEDGPNGDIQLVLNHMREILCNSNDRNYEYLMKWLAYVVQTSKKPNTAIINTGRRYIGRKMFWKFFTEKVIGINESYRCHILPSITDHRNSIMIEKRVLLVDNFIPVNSWRDELRSLVVSDSITVSSISTGLVSVPSYHCIVMIADGMCLMKENDMEYKVIDCADIKRDRDYFINLKRCTDSCAGSFYRYLMNRDISNFTP